jgi:hypothetical protein
VTAHAWQAHARRWTGPWWPETAVQPTPGGATASVGTVRPAYRSGRRQARLQQLENNALDVLADIAGFGERRPIGQGEGHFEDARKRLCRQRLARAGGPDQQDARFGEFNVIMLVW